MNEFEFIETRYPICPNCNEAKFICACIRNRCTRCGNPVGNITFSVCDDCWAKSLFETKSITPVESMDKPIERTIVLYGGCQLTLEQCKEALDEAMQIMAKVGTTGIEHAWPKANEWMLKYYPQWA